MDMLTRIAGRTSLVANLILGVGLAGVIGIELALTVDEFGARSIGLPASVGVGAIALFRERHRAWALTGGLVICAAAAVISLAAQSRSQPGFAATAALLVLGASYVRIATARRTGLVLIAGLVVLTVGRIELRASLVLPVAFLGVIAWCAALGVGLWLRSLDLHRRAAIAAVRHDERLELARELHDVVAHHIAAIVVQSQAAQLRATKRPGALPGALAEIESAGSDALIAMRRVVGLLRQPDDVQGVLPGTEQLGDLVRRFSARGRSVEVHLAEAADDPAAWAPEIRTTVYRVTQEALTNIVRHAPEARVVRVMVDDDPIGLRIEITNDGPHQPPQPPWSGGYGLVGMRERVEALRGRFQAGPGPDGGWTVLATIPRNIVTSSRNKVTA